MNNIIELLETKGYFKDCTLEKKQDLIELIKLAEGNMINLSNTKKIQYIQRNIFKFPSMGSTTKKYWIARGWSEIEANVKVKQIQSLKPKRLSPFSVEFWISKGFSKEEALFERNSRRPINKEYWVKKGFSDEESILKAKETKDNNNKKGATQSSLRDKEKVKSTSMRCAEYWLLRGYSEDEAKQQVSQRQNTFNKEKCIENYGEIEGLKVWKERQDKWQNTLNSKSDKEIEEINIKKGSLYFVLMETFQFTHNETIDTIKQIDEENLKLYNREIDRLTEITYKQYIDEIDSDRLRGRTDKGSYDLDHKVSRTIGFIFNIEPKIMSCKYNLQILKAGDNKSKNTQCSIDIDELKQFYYDNQEEINKIYKSSLK